MPETSKLPGLPVTLILSDSPACNSEVLLELPEPGSASMPFAWPVACDLTPIALPAPLALSAELSPWALALFAVALVAFCKKPLKPGLSEPGGLAPRGPAADGCGAGVTCTGLVA